MDRANMARILLTWELGAGLGHVTRLSAMANAIESLGHEVYLATCNLPLCFEHFRNRRAHLLQAPLNLEPRFQIRIPFSYTHVLYNCGFAEADRLEARLRAWQSLFSLVDPAVILADHSPSALLAARSRFLATSIGTGFECPPNVGLLPNIRPHIVPDPTDLQRIESEVLSHINVVAKRLNIPPLEYIAQLFGASLPLLLTYKELDPYSDRMPPNYLGVVEDHPKTEPQWPPGNGQRVFLYLKYFPQLTNFLNQLLATGYVVVAFLPDSPEELWRSYSSMSSRIAIHKSPVNVRRMAIEADVAVTHGGHGTTCQVLLAGCQTLILPVFLEQAITGYRVSALQAGLCADINNLSEMLTQIDTLVNAGVYRRAAESFAKKYATSDSRITFLHSVESLIRWKL